MSDVDAGAPPAGCVTRPVRLFLKALASEGRQQAMMLFAGGAELSVGEVAARLGTGQSTASQQLAMLREGGLLSARREGKTVWYRADPAGIAAALGELQDCLAACCPRPGRADYRDPAPGTLQDLRRSPEGSNPQAADTS